MKLLVIGHTVEDHIIVDGEEKINPGGIFYTSFALMNYIESDDEVYLNTAVQKENYNLFEDVYKNFNSSYIKFIDKIPKVYLTLHNFKERGETYESMSRSLEVEIAELNLFDGILINMITGFDISLDQIKDIRNNYGGLIYLDVHTLSRGLDENLKREFRRIPNFDEWASSVDILQANENEILTFSDKLNEREIAEEILNFGTKIFIVTKGKLGARLYSRRNDELISIFNSSLKIENKNMVGCGDVFGAVFFYNYIKTKDLVKSLQLANVAAGCAASYTDLKNFNNLKKDVLSRYN
ncbi:MAG: carbohydrate kinase family protein [Bacteroidetes bacterium]|nr:carbohydrate kinase family protein [Bacteroidota bacterium]